MHATELIKPSINAQKAGDQPGRTTVAAHGLQPHGRHRRGAGRRHRGQVPGQVRRHGRLQGLRPPLRPNLLLREHVLLAGSATGAALGGRMPQFEAVAAALNGPTNSNTADLVAAISSVYGPESEGVRRTVAQREAHPRSSSPTPRPRPRTTRPARTPR